MPFPAISAGHRLTNSILNVGKSELRRTLCIIRPRAAFLRNVQEWDRSSSGGPASSPWLKPPKSPGLKNIPTLRCCYVDGYSQAPAATGAALGYAYRAGDGAGASFLYTAEPTSG